MNNLNLEHHVKIRNALLKKQSLVSERMLSLSKQKLASNLSRLAKSLVDIDISSCKMEMDTIRIDIIAQQVLIDKYMVDLEN